MEDMISKELQQIQESYTTVEGRGTISPENWSTGVIIKLLEVTHGQLFYRCIQVHDRAQGTLMMNRKEELQKEI